MQRYQDPIQPVLQVCNHENIIISYELTFKYHNRLFTQVPCTCLTPPMLIHDKDNYYHRNVAWVINTEQLLFKRYVSKIGQERCYSHRKGGFGIKCRLGVNFVELPSLLLYGISTSYMDDAKLKRAWPSSSDPILMSWHCCMVHWSVLWLLILKTLPGRQYLKFLLAAFICYIV